MKLRVFEAFAGYGSQAMALEKLKKDYPEFDFEVVGISEIEKNAITAYNAVHGETKNYGDISKINWTEVPDFDFFTYSFPCTDISASGRQEGFAEGSGTRSSLLWDCKMAITAKKPKYLMMENVKALTQKKFMPYFNQWIGWLDEQGYSSFWKVINATQYNVPQNRERVFMVSILRTEDDPNPQYHFPEPVELKKKIEDVIELDVDEAFYLSDESLQKFMDVIHNENRDIKDYYKGE